MARKIHPAAGKQLDRSELIDVERLVLAYYAERPHPDQPAQRIAFGTSGHRGSALDAAFNEAHIMAIAQAISFFRSRNAIDGPLFIGMDTHALSMPAFVTAIEVFAGNGVVVMIDDNEGYTPTPVISHAILQYNKGRTYGHADGVVITPSHNPPEDGGFKYNPPHGGPAGPDVTSAIERMANELLEGRLRGVSRVPYQRARASPAVRRHNYRTPYVADLAKVVDLEAVGACGLKIGVDPLGGAGVDYWPAIIERYRLDATLVSNEVDPRFGFMTADWDGRIRMDCSSPYAMARLVGLRERFDISFGNDPDADRHGIVTRSEGLMNPNHYLAAAASYLFTNRAEWGPNCAIGKTMVTSSLLDRLAVRLGRDLVETPVGFRWFVEGLLNEKLGFAGEESAGASLLRRDGSVWTTEKDGIALALLAAEMTARAARDPGEIYAAVAQELGTPYYERLDAPATPEKRALLQGLSTENFPVRDLAGEPVLAIESAAPGTGHPLGGIRVKAQNGWFAARPSGTEDIYKIYAESFLSEAHLRRIQKEAQTLVGAVGGSQAQAGQQEPTSVA